jgi:hypothetical protein
MIAGKIIHPLVPVGSGEIQDRELMLEDALLKFRKGERSLVAGKDYGTAA